MGRDIFGEQIHESQPSPEGYDPFADPADDLGQEGGLEVSEAPVEGQPTPNEPVNYAGKFKSEEALEEGYINLMEQLGKELGTFTNAKDLEAAYLEAEKEFSRSKQKPKEQKPKEQKATPPNAELEELKKTVQEQHLQMQQMIGYLNALATQAQNSPQQAQQQGQSEEVDPAALLEEFYENPQKALEKMVNPMLQSQLQNLVPEYAKHLNEQLEKQLAPVYQTMQLQNVTNEWVSAVDELIRELPDFDALRGEVSEEIERDPNLVMMAQYHPERAKFALRVAYDRVKAIKVHEEGLGLLNEQKKQQSVLQKQAGKMGSSRRVLIKEPSPEELEIQKIFGEETKRKGIFG